MIPLILGMPFLMEREFLEMSFLLGIPCLGLGSFLLFLFMMAILTMLLFLLMELLFLGKECNKGGALGPPAYFDN